MRWMYLAWGVNPYPADGWDVVRDYDLFRAQYNPDGPQLVVVTNGTVGTAPQPGDVVSVGRTRYDNFGHTAVVTANAVDAQGEGTITLIQQNGGAGNDGWATYPVNNWVVADGVTGWLHNPSWTFQWPLVGYTGPAGFEAGVTSPGNDYGQVTTDASSISVSGYAGSVGANGDTLFGYIDSQGNFFVQQGSSATWYFEAQHAKSIAVTTTASGVPVLAFLSANGDFYAEQGSLTGPFTLEATGATSIALAAGGGSAPPLLGYVRAGDAAFLVKTGIAGDAWTAVQASGVRSIALAEGSTPTSGLMGYVSDSGVFYASEAAPEISWTARSGRRDGDLRRRGRADRRTAPRLPRRGWLLRGRKPHPDRLGRGGDRCGRDRGHVELRAGRFAGPRLCHDRRRPLGAARSDLRPFLAAGQWCLVACCLERHQLLTGRRERS